MRKWDDGYGTHLPVLLDALRMNGGPVLEMGAGYWSTPFLHQLCWDRQLVTWEPHGAWFDLFAPMAETSRHTADRNSSGHQFAHTLPAVNWQHWGVILVDGPVETRCPALDLDADIFVVHDTEPNHRMLYSGLEDRLAEFKHRRDYEDLYPWTTMASNTQAL